MKRIIKFILIFVIIATVGTLSHFIYDWSGENIYLAFLWPTNESIFEHLKMFFFPIMLVSLFEVAFIKENKGLFLTSRLYGSLFSIIGCIAFYYTYKTIAPEVVDFVYIASYYVLLFLGLFISYNIYRYMKTMPEYLMWLAFSLGVIITIVFICYTYKPLDNEFFMELTNSKM